MCSQCVEFLAIATALQPLAATCIKKWSLSSLDSLNTYALLCVLARANGRGYRQTAKQNHYSTPSAMWPGRVMLFVIAGRRYCMVPTFARLERNFVSNV